MKVALVHSEYENLPDLVAKINPRSPIQMKNTVKEVGEALRSKGHEVVNVEANIYMMENIMKEDVDVIFCHYMPMLDLNNQGNVFAALELLGIPMVGSGMYPQAVSLSKETTKDVLRRYDIPVAESQVFFKGDEPLKDELKEKFPLFAKPESESMSVGVDDNSLVNNEEEMRNKVKEIIDIHNTPVLVEEYLPGREFTIGVLEGRDGKEPPEALPVVELVFKPGSKFQTVARKASGETKEECPADISEELTKKLQEYAVKAFLALRAETNIRIDSRLDKDGNPVVLEANIMPGIDRTMSSFIHETEAAGIAYEDLIERMVTTAYNKERKKREFEVGRF